MSLLARLVPARSARHTGNWSKGDPPAGRIGRAWRRFVDQISPYRWWIRAAAGITAFVLGCVGWWKFQCERHPTDGDAAFIVYWIFKDFLMNSPSEQVIPWQLNVARFLAPLAAGWAGYTALASIFRDRIQLMRIPMMRRHVVICGLGKYVGTIFLRHLRHDHFGVVVIEQDVTNPNIELCRSWGVPVIIGDAQ